MIKVLDVFPGNTVNFSQEKVDGVGAVIIKLGQGQYSEYIAEHCDYIEQVKALGMNWGGYWVSDARFSPESHKAAVKAYFPSGDFGPLGLWIDVEKPMINMSEDVYRHLPYSFYKSIESFARGMVLHSKTGVGIYTSKGQWQLCAGIVPDSVSEWFATLPLWTAQYQVLKPEMYGKWKSAKMWQWRGDPDYSWVLDESWYYSKVGGTVTPSNSVTHTLNVYSSGEVKNGTI